MVRVPGTCPLPERNITLVEHNCTIRNEKNASVSYAALFL